MLYKIWNLQPPRKKKKKKEKKKKKKKKKKKEEEEEEDEEEEKKKKTTKTEKMRTATLFWNKYSEPTVTSKIAFSNPGWTSICFRDKSTFPGQSTSLHENCEPELKVTVHTNVYCLNLNKERAFLNKINYCIWNSLLSIRKY